MLDLRRQDRYLPTTDTAHAGYRSRDLSATERNLSRTDAAHAASRCLSGKLGLKSRKQCNSSHVLCFNAQSVVSKLPSLHLLLNSFTHDIIVITETWLKPIVTNSLLCPDGTHSVFRSDRKRRKGGGVAVLVAPSIVCYEVSANVPSCCNVVCLDVCSSPTSTWRLIAVYRPPSCTVSDSHELLDVLVELSACTYPVIITGDLNLPNCTWSLCPTALSGNTDEQFSQFAVSSCLVQMVNFPTRAANTLDVVLTSDTSLVTCLKPVENFASSDHVSLSFSVLSPTSLAEDRTLIYDYTKADFTSMNNHLANIDWNATLFSMPTVDEAYSLLCSILADSVRRFVPTRFLRRASPKLPEHITNIINYRKQLWANVQHNQETRPKFIYVT